MSTGESGGNIHQTDDTRARDFDKVEYKQIWQRRKQREALAVPESPQTPDGPAPRPPDLLGLAISGGGIRSAIFSLGVLQAFANAKRNLLENLDYLSTVSGGTYIGMFFAALHVPSNIRKLSPKQQETPEGPPSYIEAWKCASKLEASCETDKHRPSFEADKHKPYSSTDYLRANANYLAPNGGGDYLLTSAIYARNWLAIQFVVGVTFSFLVTLTVVLRLLIQQFGIESWFWPSRSLTVSLPECIGSCTSLAIEKNGLIWWSPTWLLAAIALALLATLHVAFWLTANAAAKRETVRQEDKDLQLKRYQLAWFRFRRLVYLLIPVVAAALIAAFAGADGGKLSIETGGVYLTVHLDSGSSSAYIGRQTYTFPPFVTYLAICIVFVVPLFVCGIAWHFSHRHRNSLIDRTGAKMRNLLTNWLVRVSVFNLTLIALLAIGFAIVDTIGQSIALLIKEGSLGAALSSFGGAGTIALAGLRWTLANRPPGKRSPLLTKLLPVIAGIAAIALLLVTLSFWSTVVHVALLARLGIHPLQLCPAEHFYSGTLTDCSNHFTPLLHGLLLLAALTVLCGLSIGILNFSSLQSMYSARLTRCFLGASNPVRLCNPADRDVTSLMPGDAIALGTYYAEASLAPVHLINMTVNNTVAWNGTRVLEHSALGFGMCVGPAGISIGPECLWLRCQWPQNSDATRVVSAGGKWLSGGVSWSNTVESLQVGDWCSISGAAVSTGLGYMTQSGYSFLLGAANIRLGYWWDSGTRLDPDKPRFTRMLQRLGHLFGSQILLFREMRGAFLGPRDQRWYLTDGGHFENTGAYELIRRRVDWIIVLDNGADLKYEFADLAVLMRRVRIDLHAEMREIHGYPRDVAIAGWEARLGNPINVDCLTEIAEFPGAGDPRYGEKFALLFEVRYYVAREGEPATIQILWIKPRIIQHTPYDVKQFALETDFPQESTADQFFDEAQWESHRKLGECQINRLFA